MKNIAILEREANNRGSIFAKKLTTAKATITPPALVNEVLMMVDPDLSNLEKIQTRLKTNPIAFLAAFTGVSLLLRQIFQPAISPKSATPLRQSRRIVLNHKGENHGRYISAK